MRRTPSSRVYFFPLMLLLGSILGCAGVITMSPVDVSSLSVTPPQLMVAKKAQDPLYLVVDPGGVPDPLEVRVPRMKPITVNQATSFLTIHLKEELEDRFDEVHIVQPDTPLPEQGVWIAKAEIVEISAILDGIAEVGRVFGTVNWSFGLMRAGASDFTFSYAGTSRGASPLAHVSQTGEMYSSTFEAGLADMLSAYTDKEIHKAVLTAESAPKESEQQQEQGPEDVVSR